MSLTTQQRAALAAEITTDPTGRGYVGKAAPAVWDLLCLSAPAPETHRTDTLTLPQVATKALADALAERDAAEADALANTILDLLLVTTHGRAALASVDVVEVGERPLPRRLAIFDGCPLGSLEDVEAALASLGG